MDLFSAFVLGVGLAMDAFTVSIASGLIVKENRLNGAFRMAGAFGGFQILMPLLGFGLGIGLSNMIAGFDHWVAFGLLVLVGLRMIYESFRKKDEGKGTNPLHPGVLLVLAVATSIDALAVGLSFAFLHTSIVVPLVIIGSITFCLCFSGFLAAGKLRPLLGDRMEVVGGLILLGIAVKILFEHLS